MLRFSACVVAGLFLAACQNETVSIPVEATELSPIVVGQSYQHTSAATGETHEINIWTPKDYKTTGETYPVLYVIDGGQDQDFFHIAGLAQLSEINGIFETPIVVGIRTSNRYFQLTPKMTDPRYLPWNGDDAAPEMGGADTFDSLIAEELLPWVAENYPVDARRILMGESLGGFYVARTFLRSPERFTDYIAISPSLWLDDQKLAKAAPELLAKHGAAPRSLYLTMADEGGTMQAGLDKLLAAIEALNASQLNLIYVTRRDTDTHSTIYHGAALDALRQILPKPAPDYGPTPWYLREGGSPEDAP